MYMNMRKISPMLIYKVTSMYVEDWNYFFRLQQGATYVHAIIPTYIPLYLYTYHCIYVHTIVSIYIYTIVSMYMPL